MKAEVIRMPLSERIRAQRKRCGLSQEKTAELIGISRQAVTKWERGQSAPSTENLFKLAEVFGTTVDLLLAPEPQETTPPASAPQARWKRNALFALATAAGYGAVYLLGRIFCCTASQSSVLGWLFGTDPTQLTYLYGWLLRQKLFWFSMAISVAPALWGKYRFSFTTLFAFGIGLLLGEQLGACPAGSVYGHSHYGWIIWGGIFLFSMAMGIVLERMKKTLTLKSKKFWIWAAIFLAGVLAIVLLILAGMPDGA